MTIGWNELRPKFGKRESFEELCCQLSSQVKYPTKSIFTRNAPPDGGVECYWTTPDGLEHAWQAKFFNDKIGAIQYKQIEDSIISALKNFKNLKTFVICIPKNLTNAQNKTWKSKEKDWKKLASKKKLKVDFVVWDSTKILSQILKPANKGLAKYFFEKTFLDQEWFKKHKLNFIKTAGPRYTEKLNVDLPISKLFDILCRGETFSNFFKKINKEINDNFRHSQTSKSESILKEDFKKITPKITSIIDFIDKIQQSEQQFLDWSKLTKIKEETKTIVNESNFKLIEEARKNNGGVTPRQYSPDHLDYHDERYHLSTLFETLDKLFQFANGKSGQMTNLKSVLIRGEAGIGKTHLFCDVAKNRIEKNKPTIVLFGSRFVKGEPWEQIRQQLHLDCSIEEFLGALETIAQSSGERALIMIDALNEGDGKEVWPQYLSEFIQRLSDYPWIAIALSVRTTYEEITINEEILSELVKITHPGFGRFAYKAAKTFFENNGIQSPSMPLFLPEFSNPQFLMVLVNGMKKQNLKKIPSGIDGYHSGLNFFINSVNKELAKQSRLGFDSNKEIVKKAALKIAEEMAKKNSRYLEYDDAEKITTKLYYDGPQKEKSLLSNLVSEKLFSEEYRKEDSEVKKIIQFGFERFGDSMIAEFLLSKELVKSKVKENFKKSIIFKNIFSDWTSIASNRGLVDALTLHLPEKYNVELISLLPKSKIYYEIIESLIQSLQWRSTKSIRKSTSEIIEKYLKNNPEHYPLLFKTILTVSTNPDNPFNANYLHNFLLKKTLGDRDQMWSTFLHDEFYSDDSVIQRYIDWIWLYNGKDNLSEKGVILAGKTLCWFLTASNRFVRDRATKALVKLLENNISAIKKIIQDFTTVNDPYVLERIYAVAYGCSLRTRNKKFLEELAKIVYKQIFHKSPPPNIFLRDYARGIIEYAIHQGVSLDIDLSRIKPPYKSNWEKKCPTSKQIESLKKISKTKDEFMDSSIHHSVFDDDFGVYVIENKFQWSKVKLLDKLTKSRQTAYREFAESITKKQDVPWKNFSYVKDNKEGFSKLTNKQLNKLFKENFGEKSFDEIYSEMYSAFENFLVSTLDDKQIKILKKIIIPYLEFKYSRKEHAFDISKIKRRVVKKVFDLGWTSKRFGQFDRRVSRFRDSPYYDNRTDHKPERIGKKYQWIAYCELLAKASDNFEFREGHHSLPFSEFNGPWQISYLRNIDPSFLLPKTKESSWKDFDSTWWFPHSYDSWAEKDSDISWIKNKKDLPSLTGFLEVENPEDNSKWFVLHANYAFQKDMAENQDKYKIPSREIWLHLRSYIVKKSNIKKIFEWAKKQNYQGIRLPDSGYSTQNFMGEYYWSDSALFEALNEYEEWVHEVHFNKKLPSSIAVTSLKYLSEPGYDCSIDGNIGIMMPSKIIFDGMDSKLFIDGKIFSSKNEVIAFDPSIEHKGPSVLLVKKETFLKFLKEKNYDVFWSYIGERRLLGGDLKVWKGGQEIYATYRHVNNKFDGIKKQLFISKETIDKRNENRANKAKNYQTKRKITPKKKTATKRKTTK